MFLSFKIYSNIGYQQNVFASNSKQDDDTNNTYEYNYNGVKIVSETQKTMGELTELYDRTVNQTQSNINDKVPFAEDPGSTVQESPVVERTIKNSFLNAGISATIGYFTRRIPKGLSKTLQVN